MRRISTRRSRKKVVSLPEELLIEILLRLQVPTLLRCKCVSKHWLRLLSSQYFVQSQLDYSIKNNPRLLFTNMKYWNYLYNLCSIGYETSYTDKTSYKTEFTRNYTITGSCNGLVCLWGYPSDVVLCNPATREYIEVKVPYIFDLHFHLGFGHDPLTNTYKFVTIEFSQHSSVSQTHQFPDCEVYVYVYTFGAKKGRRISTSRIPFCLCNLKDRGPCLNGVVHWRTRSMTSIDEEFFYSIVGFDVGKEEFRQIAWTPPSTDNQKSVFLAEIQGCLSLICTSYDGITDIWYMKDYGVQESWTKLYSLSPSDDRIPSLKFLKKTETLISITSEKIHKYLYTYDQTNKHVCQYAPFSSGFENGAQAYVESLISIASLSMGKRQSQRNRRPPDRLKL